MSTAGRTIRLFLVDGSPSGILTAEIMNWTGHVLYGPRTRIADLLKREEVKRTGLYLLIGQSAEASGQPIVYVGETDNVRKRLMQHNADETKDFWDFACLITSKDQNLTKAHVRYLESRIISLVKEEGRAILDNSTSPEYGYLPEADLADMDYFTEQLRVLLPSIGLEFLRPTPVVERAARMDNVVSDPSAALDPFVGHSTELNTRNVFGQERPTAQGGSSPVFTIDVLKPPIRARAVETDGRIVVLEGSEAREEERGSLSEAIRSRRRQLIETGKLLPSDRPGVLRFTDDVAFTSPSGASSAIHGTSRNGRSDWVVQETGESYAQWQEALLGSLSIEENED